MSVSLNSNQQNNKPSREVRILISQIRRLLTINDLFFGLQTPKALGEKQESLLLSLVKVEGKGGVETDTFIIQGNPNSNNTT